MALTLAEMAAGPVRRPETPAAGARPAGGLSLAQMASAKPAAAAKAGSVAGYPISAGRSNDPIHYGTHAGNGVYDIGGMTAKRLGKTLDAIARDLGSKGYIAAVRRVGQRNISSDHIHFVDPKANPKEAKRLISQRKSGVPGIFGPMDLEEVVAAGTPKPTPVESALTAAVTPPKRKSVPEIWQEAVARKVAAPPEMSETGQSIGVPHAQTDPKAMVNAWLGKVGREEFKELAATLPTRTKQQAALKYWDSEAQRRARKESETKANVFSAIALGSEGLAKGMGALGEAIGEAAAKRAPLPLQTEQAQANIKNIAGAAPYFVPGVGDVAMVGQVPYLLGREPGEGAQAGEKPPMRLVEMAKTAAHRVTHPMETVKKGEVINSLMDIGLIYGLGKHAIKAGKALGAKPEMPPGPESAAIKTDAELLDAAYKAHPDLSPIEAIMAEQEKMQATMEEFRAMTPQEREAFTQPKGMTPEYLDTWLDHVKGALDEAYYQHAGEAQADVIQSVAREAEAEKWSRVSLPPAEPITGLRVQTGTVRKGPRTGEPVWGKPGALGYRLDDIVDQLVSRDATPAERDAALADIQERIRANAPHDRKSMIDTGDQIRVRDFGELSSGILTKAEVDALVKSTGGGITKAAKVKPVGPKANETKAPAPPVEEPAAQTRSVAETTPEGGGGVTQPIEAHSPPLQWHKIKEQYPDVMLLFRDNGTYRAYGEDARKLEGWFGQSEVPAADVDSLTAKIVAKGERVALADQIAQSGGGGGGTHASTVEAQMPTATGAPVFVGDPIRASQIAQDIRDTLLPVRTGRFRQKAFGIYKVREEVVRLGRANNLSTLSHEIGHHLQKVFFPDVRTKRGNLSAKAFPRELWPQLTQLAPGRTEKVVEGWANYVRLYLTDPAQAAQKAWKVDNWFKRQLAQYPEIQKVIDKAQRDIDLWNRQPAQAKVQSTLSIGEPDPKQPLSWDKFYGQWFDELQGLRRAEEAITKGQEIPPSRSAFTQAWRNRGGAGRATAWLDHAVTDLAGNRRYYSLKEILQPVAADLDGFRRFITAAHGLEVIKAKGRDAMPLTAQEYAEVLAQAPPQYQEALNRLVRYQDFILDDLIDAGMLTQDAKARMRALYPNYVPFYRVLPEKTRVQGIGRGEANLRSPIKKLKGSGLDIKDPLESIVRNTYTMLNIADRNRVMVKLDKLAGQFEGSGHVVEYVPPKMQRTQATLGEVLGMRENDPRWADIEELLAMDPDTAVNIFRPVYLGEAAKNVVTVYRNGRPKLLQLDENLYNAVTAADAQTANIVTRLFEPSTKLLRLGATTTGEFAVRNQWRDMLSAMVLSKHGVKPWDIAAGLFHAVRKDDLYYKWMSSGGAQSTMLAADRLYMQDGLRHITHSGLRAKAKEAIRHPVETARKAFQPFEESTRLAEFGKATDWGRTKDLQRFIEGAIDSRDVTVDFGRAGAYGKQVNKVVAFFNAQAQGLDKMARSFKENPTRFMARGFTYVTAPTIALYAMNRGNPEYQKLQEWDKDLFWHVWTGGVHLRIPKPFELGIIFGAVPERIARWIDEADPYAFDGLAQDIATAMLPDVLPTILVPWVAVKSNKSFTGAPIVPNGELEQPPQLQRGPQNTAVAKQLGKALGVSPRQIDYLINGYGGGVARYATEGFSAILERTGMVPSVPRPAAGLEKVPIVRGLVANPFSQPVQVTRLYDELERLDKKAKLAEAGEGDALTPEEDKRLRELRFRADALSGIRKAQRAIDTAPDMTYLRAWADAAGIPVKDGDIGQAKRQATLYLRKMMYRAATSDVAKDEAVARYKQLKYARVPKDLAIQP